MKYNHKKIETKWQKFWQKNEVYKTQDNKEKPKYYILDMFPYPSGAGLHVGHPKGYIATDIIARMKMMQGHNVLHPMGWDAFGLPAENYAIKNKVHPRKAVENNVKVFKEQLQKIGFTYDWSREVNTTDKDYYKWTQWTFLKMFEKGLAYESEEPIIWCPSCQTGLAMEDLEDGKCERCSSEIERKPMRQWVLKITDYAERLLNDLDKLDKWPDSIREMQRHWIGKSEGAEVKFSIANSQSTINVFTTRADTLFGATFMVLAPEHPLVQEITTKENKKQVEKYIKQASGKSDLERAELQKDKSGVFSGAYAINPVNNKEIPIWIADYVLMNYGTGAIMAVPAHDERDFEFALKYDLPIEQVISPMFVDPINPPQDGFKEVCRDTVLAFLRDKNTGKYALLDWHGTLEGITTTIMGGIDDGETPEDAARKEISEEAGLENVKLIKKSRWITDAKYCASHKKENRHAKAYGLLFEVDNLKQQKDIPTEESAKHTLYWVSEKEVVDKLVPIHQKFVWLQILEETALAGDGHLINSAEFDGLEVNESIKKITSWLEKKKIGQAKIQYKLQDWVFSRQRYWGEPIPIIHCEKCGPVAVPEKDLPVELPDVKSYEPTGTGESPLAGIDEWVNVKCPKCGGSGKRETNTMPQWAGSNWYYLRYIDPDNDKALVDKEKEKYWSPIDFYVGGAEHATRHLIYSRFWHKFLFDIKAVSYDEPFTRLQNVGLIMSEDGRKMSKRWNNVINPDDIIKEYGADALRAYEMFMGPFNQAATWDTNGLRGVKKFLDKVWSLGSKESKDDSQEVVTLLHKTIRKVTGDIETMDFNTAISQMMIFVNKIQTTGCSQQTFKTFLQVLSPFAPHVCEELWSNIGEKQSIFLSEWPKYDEKLIIENVVEIPVQINGKVRVKLQVAPDIPEAELKKLVLADEQVQRYLEDKELKKFIYVKGRLVSLVV